MQVFQHVPPLIPGVQPVVTFGHFDGIHRGHQALLRAMVARSRQLGAPAILITVSPHPQALGPKCNGFYLTSDKERMGMVEQLGVDQLVVLPPAGPWFEPCLHSWMTWLKEHFDMQELWLGPAARWAGSEGNDATPFSVLAEQMGFALQSVPPVCVDGAPVSSASIRAAISTGDISLVNACLGRSFRLHGFILQDDQASDPSEGTTLKVVFDREHARPKDGVYLCRVRFLDQCQEAPVDFEEGFSHNPSLAVAKIHLAEKPGELSGQPIAIEVLDHRGS